MPELPEVEVVKRSLIKNIQNLIIKGVKINDVKLRYSINKKKITKIIGLRLKKIKRKSKFLLFFFNKNIVMLIHLGMTGKLYFVNRKDKKYRTSFYYDVDQKKENKHDRVIFYLEKNQKLIYNDVRKFGFIKFYNFESIHNSLHLKGLGPEPLEKNFTFKYLKKYVNGKKRSIKDILMDQKFVSGLGNIYVNEILFSSRIKPDRKADKIKVFEMKKIIFFTKKILKYSIKTGGSSIKDFTSINGKKGSFQQHFQVYGKKGDICSNINCNKKILKMTISGRATFYCLKCQK
ncbi:bifunctional DNA-formamidopyrimidine glycosylase/DNA-(apurinic or apyrimidinic site) lyase [Pelagibacteraceae bacterium]|nr:bifunctional DNA-formamidopyrimidine glycosylase/DNA-(apurinic or apyrimidinic site) lyase [Pelagibacteraceae bacterium]